MPDYKPEPWEEWGLSPHVPDNRTTYQMVKEIIDELPPSNATISQVPCAYFKVGIHRKKSRCWNRAEEGSSYCRQHRRNQ